MWLRLWPKLRSDGRATEDDRESFEDMVTAWALMRTAAKSLFEDGLTAPGAGPDRKSEKKAPAFQEWRDAGATFRAGADRFGLNPKARRAMRTAPAGEGGGDDAGGILD